jgi:hypothetical protein
MKFRSIDVEKKVITDFIEGQVSRKLNFSLYEKCRSRTIYNCDMTILSGFLCQIRGTYRTTLRLYDFYCSIYDPIYLLNANNNTELRKIKWPEREHYSANSFIWPLSIILSNEKSFPIYLDEYIIECEVSIIINKNLIVGAVAF